MTMELERITHGILEYDSNNSGGSWWLDTSQWEALEEAGWNVHWGERVYGDDALLTPVERTGNTWLGAEAVSAAKRFADANEGVNEWARITGEQPEAEGCNCCGPPHTFTWHGDDGSRSYGSAVVVQTALSWS